MLSKYTLRYLPIAEEDLISILDWIANDSPTQALIFIDKLEERIGKPERFPPLGRIPRNLKLREYGYRVLVVESYLVFYIVRRKTVEVHRVIRASRNIEEML